MNNTIKYTDLNDFLSKHSAKNNENNEKSSSSYITHTRIGDKNLNIYGGSYVIPREELQTFYKLYYDKIFVSKNNEHLTEKQLEKGGPMAVDFDFRYSYDIDTRKHTKTHIVDMVTDYLEVLKECFLFKEIPFHIFIFEKPNVNRLSDKSITKDGIHMLICIQVDHTMQLIIREKMLKKLPETWEDLPIINSWDSVLDDGICKGTTNWQLFGSKKPGNEAYELTQHFITCIDPSDYEFMLDEKKVSDFDLKNNFEKLSVQYDNHPVFEINPKIVDEYNKKLENKTNKIKKSSKIKMKLIVEDEDEDEDQHVSLNDIKNKDVLEKAVAQMLNKFTINEYEITETHYFTQALPEKYYEPGSHLLNRQVAFALKNTDERLFLSWIMLRSKASDFDYNTIPDLYCEWKKFHKANQENNFVTKRSIMYWVKKDNFEEYERIKKETIDFYIEESLKTGTEYDIAKVVNNVFKDKYICISYDKKGIWYTFKKHRWIQDKGLSLREKISTVIFDLYQKKMDKTLLESNEFNNQDDRKTFLTNKMKQIGIISTKLKKTNDKNNIMREASEIFYDGEFIRNMDTKKNLLCFTNGVVDFTNKIFREGYPEDYITKTTRIPYIPFNEKNAEIEKYSSEINEFMNKLFPIKDLNRYMWDHLASSLIGTNKNQTFNVYHGSGSNGKSIIADLMSATLGDYKGTVPITLVTEKRGLIGGTSDEVLKLKGVRYAVMQEPSKGVKLNEGIMKELTGGDPIQARGLYSESEVFEPQFNLVVCTNNLFDIESNDDGTWRRICKCDFLSKFVDEGERFNDDTPYVYVKDKSLKDKLSLFAPVFASMLVKRAFETEGIVTMCETVMNASNKYRKGQDHISSYITERIIKTNDKNDKIGKRGLYDDFKLWFQQEQGARKIPKGEELNEYMNKKFGECTKKGWIGIKFAEKEEDEEDLIDSI